MQQYLQALRNYAVFTGRARRKEYWMFVLFNMLFAFAAAIADNIIGFSIGGLGYGYIYMLYTLAMIVPGISIGVRRLHDVGKSGWFMLILFIPLIGAIWLLVLACTEGTQGDSEYGPDPKAPAFAF
ncbi:DUF805 domain-containing protein [Hymenobacter arizonensis]|uniref:Uncharacterized membrane protein YhaH, DUF805 family n=1 Tax=Hymenobacter arizonensis TaxID=1227077 RepID=A0A1I6AE42_HYMAR|nr:DUF805 domain-containing protein [Hymenobacter arizonensis]SFQ66912.1 Uncharacterized membrane protein YhaH, DUF805 family [Hymenobacter arizonensis]